MKHLTMLLPLLCLGLLACGRQAQAPDPAVLAAQEDRFCQDSQQRGLDGWLAHFDRQAAIFPAGRPIVAGLDSIKAHYQRTKFDPRGLLWKAERAGISASGDLGYTYGYWETKGRDKDGKEVTYRGKYLTVWKRQADGTWKLVADMGSL